MSYEVFRQKATRLGAPALTITTDGRFALNADAGDIMRAAKATLVQILWDADARKVALRPVTKADDSSYRVTPQSGANTRRLLISAASFLRSIGWDYSKRRTLPVQWNEKEGILECALPAAGTSAPKEGRRP